MKLSEVETYIRERCKDEKSADEVWAVYHDADLHCSDFAADCDRLQKQVDKMKKVVDAAKQWKDSMDKDDYDYLTGELYEVRPGIKELMLALKELEEGE